MNCCYAYHMYHDFKWVPTPWNWSSPLCIFVYSPCTDPIDDFLAACRGKVPSLRGVKFGDSDLINFGHACERFGSVYQMCFGKDEVRGKPLIDWLIDWLIDQLINWLIDWLIDRSQSIDRLIDWRKLLVDWCVHNMVQKLILYCRLSIQPRD